MSSLSTRIIGSLVFGFTLVFAFAAFMQISTELINFITGFQIRFLFPGGARLALNDPAHVLSVIASLTFTALVASGIFFVWKLRPRRGSLIWDDDDQGDA